MEDNQELRKIKKVQSFFRGWLCRRRWKQIVEQYIKSPHAESMRKRNSLVFRMVEAEEEYMEQMEVLVSCFLRPFKMAASSKRPPCSHEDVNSIFLNSETVLFLHQIFLKGLTSRLESWPTLVLGDLFDMLLPMLSIYQEYVRNHHYSLQVLTECKGSAPFAALLTRLENKPACQGRSLEAFLTYPMHQIPRYIITLHELLAHTPHDHVERRSLQNARQQLEDLSRQMHDEVSETENLRKNLAVERMIVEGCDILLDVNQVFVRQGSLVQLPASRTRGARGTRSRLASFKSERDTLRQCFLFSNHLIIATRTSGGRLHLVPDVGKIPMADAILIEDPSECAQNEEDASESASVCSLSSQSSEASSVTSSLHPLHNVTHHHPQAPSNASTAGTGGSAASASNGNQGIPPIHLRDFKILVDGKTGGQLSVHLGHPLPQPHM
ncbi:ras-specific guanine nucleotide-releasing factor 2-like [Ctenocephalides felis]|uniref:ras-specific guanine nucleotide-releasing factor 2-like n=1 Tax=Ctenocephalides felis TaxID=7515 RepID=UPI000E6E308D|nr:ras-specific guanine nucleotide-releasing factor 2-like [Ctenocephalides felis]